MPLKPSFLALEAQMGGRFSLAADLPTTLAQAEGYKAHYKTTIDPNPTGVNKSDTTVNKIPIRIYTPASPKDPKIPLPIIIYSHGGGLIVFDMDLEDNTCILLCRECHVVVISVEYRLAPGTKWPGQLEDCFEVYSWAFDHASSFNGDPARMYTGGGSAGGLLALAQVRKVWGDEKLRGTLKGVIALYPATVHWENVPARYVELYGGYRERKGEGFDPTPNINWANIELCWREAGLTGRDVSAWAVLAVEEMGGFVPVYLVSAEVDPVCGDAMVLEQALKDVGVSVRHDHYEGLGHFFHDLPLPESEEFKEKLVQGARWLLDK